MLDLTNLYRHSLALLTDQYQLTMAYGYWKLGRAEEQAAFHLFFRTPPFGGRYTVAAGLAAVTSFLEHLRFTEDDVAYLGSLTDSENDPLFEPGFLDALRDFEFRCDVDAVPEGSVVFPHEPLVRVTGPLMQAQLLETTLLNLVNFPTLVATKAARICQVAPGPVLEFGLRRAHGIDGGVTASRASFLGGCAATSNVLAGKLYGIPVKGTHAHSWVMSFDEERTAFEGFARAMPANCIFLVDTYDTIAAVHEAIAVGRQLREQGHELVGVRLDSGDFASLSRQVRGMLDAAGFEQAKILASGDLDEYAIEDLTRQGAKLELFGVGTKLATAFEQPALGGVYKLGAIRTSESEPWQMRVKRSEDAAKSTTPGVLQVRRFTVPGEAGSDAGEPETEAWAGPAGRLLGDVIYHEPDGPPEKRATPPVLIRPGEPADRLTLPPHAVGRDVLVPVFRSGRRVYDPPDVHEARQWARGQLAALPDGVKRLRGADAYPTGLSLALHERRARRLRADQSGSEANGGHHA